MKDYTGFDTDPGPLPDLHKFLMRKMAWDMLPHDGRAPRIMEGLGLAPASADVAEIEMNESHLRTAKLAPIGELVTTYASMATAVLGSSMMSHRGDVSPETAQVYMQMTFDMIRVATFAIIGLLIETDALRLGTNQVHR